MSKIKGLTFLFFISLTASATLQADDNHPALDTCFKKVRSYYSKNAIRSDVPRGFNKFAFLPANTSVEINPQIVVGNYESDVVLYKGTGSLHSGYYIDLIVADAKTCEGLSITNIYGE